MAGAVENASRDNGAGGSYAKQYARLEPQHERLLIDSAIDPPVSRERGYRTETVKTHLRRLGFSSAQCLTPALLLPIWNVRGEPAGYQLRPDQPRMKDNRVVKYETSANMHMAVDVHPRLSAVRTRDNGAPYWDVSEVPPLLADPSVPLWITEGVRKADSALSIGLCCISLLGVWNWRGSNGAGGKTVLADWESIALEQRRVYLAFDSDAAHNAQVRQALLRLTAFVESRGAQILFICLPAGPYGRKVGLDDYIATRKKDGRDSQQIINLLLTLAHDRLEIAEEPAGDGGNGYVRKGLYAATEQGLVRYSINKEGGEEPHPLTNFTALIVADIRHDDGAETTRNFNIELKHGGRTAAVTVGAAQFPALRWAIEALGAEAVVYAGSGTTDHARVAIQLLSGSPARRFIYMHTGWRKIGDTWVYLHAGGGIGAQGAEAGVEVSLPPELAPFKLELPANSEAQQAAITASLRFLDIGPDVTTVPLYLGVWRAILGGSDFTLFEYGRTGSFKTELAALIQQHFGAGFDARHLPTGFTSTANTNEMLAFTAQDAVLVIDDLHPPPSGRERDVMFRDAARLFRSQGNAAGRGRMRADGTLRPAKPPRGLLLATGEDLPRGQSVHARMFACESAGDDVDKDRLTACQADAAAGLYAQATGAFIRWLAAHLDEAREDFRRVRNEARAGGHYSHARTTDICAQLIATSSIFTAFLIDAEVIDAGEAEQLQTRISAALVEAAGAQARLSMMAEPAAAFIRLLSSAIGSGAAHIANAEGLAPPYLEQACGWRQVRLGTGDFERTEWQPYGSRVGWIDRDDIYLDRDSAYRAAQSMAVDGNGIEVSASTLTRRLHEKHLLVTVDATRETLSVRQTLEGRRRDVMHLHAVSLGLVPEADDEN
jgi:hypothetical protein